MDTKTENKINGWLHGNYDEETKSQIQQLQKDDATQLEEHFTKIWSLEPAVFVELWALEQTG